MTFTMEWPPRSGREQAFPEVDRGAFFAPDEAARRILPAQAPLLEESPGRAPSGRLRRPTVRFDALVVTSRDVTATDARLEDRAHRRAARPARARRDRGRGGDAVRRAPPGPHRHRLGRRRLGALGGRRAARTEATCAARARPGRDGGARCRRRGAAHGRRAARAGRRRRRVRTRSPACRAPGSGRARPAARRELFARATADERDFLARLLFGELRQGALDGVMVEARGARAAGCRPPRCAAP